MAVTFVEEIAFLQLEIKRAKNDSPPLVIGNLDLQLRTASDHLEAVRKLIHSLSKSFPALGKEVACFITMCCQHYLL